jgi:hypothetical protein
MQCRLQWIRKNRSTESKHVKTTQFFQVEILRKVIVKIPIFFYLKNSEYQSIVMGLSRTKSCRIELFSEFFNLTLFQ